MKRLAFLVIFMVANLAFVPAAQSKTYTHMCFTANNFVYRFHCKTNIAQAMWRYGTGTADNADCGTGSQVYVPGYSTTQGHANVSQYCVGIPTCESLNLCYDCVSGALNSPASSNQGPYPC